MEYVSLGKRIKSERLKLNLAQEKIAESIDFTQSSYPLLLLWVGFLRYLFYQRNKQKSVSRKQNGN